MTERSLFWNGIILGDHGPYSQIHFNDQFFRSLLNGTGDRGVLKGWLDELETSGTTSPLTVATGGAAVYGGTYENTAPVSVVIPTPTTATDSPIDYRTDLIVLQRDWPSKLTRIARVQGDTTGAAPALTQTPLVRYEIPLASVKIYIDGVIEITDTREWATFSTQWGANSADSEQFETGAVTAAKIPNRTRYFIKGAGQLYPDGTNAAVWTAGGSYDYWLFADAAVSSLWIFDVTPFDQGGATIDVILWTVPDVNGAGGGAENAHWDYSYDLDFSNEITVLATGNVLADQQARVNTTVYRDLLVTIPLAAEGQLTQVLVSRDGTAGDDSYASDMRLLGVEFSYTAET